MEIEPENIANMIRIYDGLKRSCINFRRTSGEGKITEGEVYLMYLNMYRKFIPLEVRVNLNEDLFNESEKECHDLGISYPPLHN